jgi:hypothetical protein
MARELVAQAADWSHRDEVWPQVVRQFNVHLTRVALEQRHARVDIERVERLARCHAGVAAVQR